MKAWCKTAQLVLDLLHEGHELIVCQHSSYVRDEHGYVRNIERGEAVRIVRDTIVRRLLADGYVVETQRYRGSCYDSISRNHIPATWKAKYRITEDHEDMKANAYHNRECEILLKLFVALQEQQRHMAHIPFRSDKATHLAQLLDEIQATTLVTLTGLSPDAAIHQVRSKLNRENGMM